MRSNLGILVLAGTASALVGIGQMTACTTADSDTGAGGAAGSTAGTTTVPGGTGGVAGTGAGGSTTTPAGGTACAKTKTLSAAKPSIGNFDSYDGAADLSSWSFPMGGESSTGIFWGTFGYGDRANGGPGTFDMTTGHSAPYALRVADTMAQNWGGGMGLWISDCLNATVFTGISFWVRGNAPKGTATLAAFMSETTPTVASVTGHKTGTCPGNDTTCINPKFEFGVTDSWVFIQAPWTAFAKGDAATGSATVAADGHNLWQIQFDIGLNFVPGATSTDPWVPVPAPYELVVDDLAFY
jgi:hypothetical protein